MRGDVRVVLEKGGCNKTNNKNQAKTSKVLFTINIGQDFINKLLGQTHSAEMEKFSKLMIQFDTV